MKLSNELAEHIWAMERRRLEAFAARLNQIELRADMDALEAAAAARADSELKPQYERVGDLAVLPIRGVILKSVPWYYEFFGINATATEQVRVDLRAALGDKQVKSILLLVDSPGGTVDGVQELADDLFAARAEKPIAAHVSDMGASAAYWLASQAETIGANETAEVGSIGVYSVYWDESKAAEEAGIKVHVVRSGPHKGMGVPGAEITKEQLSTEQQIVNGIASSFIAAVARGRGAGEEQIAKLATGRTWLAAEATRLGLIDRVQNSEAAIAGSPPAGTIAKENVMPEEKEKLTPDKSAEGQAETEAQENAQTASPVVVEVETKAEKSAAEIEKERERAAAIIEMAQNAGLPDLAAELVTKGESVDAAARAILQAAQEKGLLGGDALNGDKKPPEKDAAAEAEQRLKAEYEKMPEAIRAVLPFEDWKKAEGAYQLAARE